MEPKVSVVSVSKMLAGASAAAAMKTESSEAAETNAQQSTYETVESKGNAWNAVVCSLGRGIYKWTTDTCDYRYSSPNWRR